MSNQDKARVIEYSSPPDQPIFLTLSGKLHPNFKYCDTFSEWLKLYSVSLPDSLEIRYDSINGIEFYGEVIALSGVILNQETGMISLDMQCLETVIARIPYRNIQFKNKYQQKIDLEN